MELMLIGKIEIEICVSILKIPYIEYINFHKINCIV